LVVVFNLIVIDGDAIGRRKIYAVFVSRNCIKADICVVMRLDEPNTVTIVVSDDVVIDEVIIGVIQLDPMVP
jgi:hypothetical protein